MERKVMSTLEEEFDAREPKSAPNMYPDVPPFPEWLKNPKIIGVDKNSNIEPWDVLAVGIYEGYEGQECADCDNCSNTVCEKETKQTPHRDNGIPYLAKSSGGKGLWIKMRYAWKEEIERYNELFLNDMNIVADITTKPYEDRLPPFPPYFTEAVVVKVDETCDGSPLAYAVALNTNDNNWWVIKTVGGRMWVSDHYATKMDFDMFDEALLREFNVVPDVKVKI
jgi:hypothetical protein